MEHVRVLSGGARSGTTSRGHETSRVDGGSGDEGVGGRLATAASALLATATAGAAAAEQASDTASAADRRASSEATKTGTGESPSWWTSASVPSLQIPDAFRPFFELGDALQQLLERLQRELDEASSGDPAPESGETSASRAFQLMIGLAELATMQRKAAQAKAVAELDRPARSASDKRRKARTAQVAMACARSAGPAGRKEADAEMVLELFEAAPFAHAAYESDEKGFLEALDGREVEILKARWVAARGKPAYVLIQNDVARSIVLCVRGTSSIHDALTDIALTSAPFHGSYAHKGMVESTDEILSQVAGVMDTALSNAPGYSVHCVGHSLGAGVAALAAARLEEHARADRGDFGLDTIEARWRRGTRRVRHTVEQASKAAAAGSDTFAAAEAAAAAVSAAAEGFADPDAPVRTMKHLGGRTVHCYAFATPACMSPELADRAARFTTSVVLGSDCVPRATEASMLALLKDLRDISRSNSGDGDSAEPSELDSALDKLKAAAETSHGALADALAPPAQWSAEAVANVRPTLNAWLGYEGSEGAEGDDTDRDAWDAKIASLKDGLSELLPPQGGAGSATSASKGVEEAGQAAERTLRSASSAATSLVDWISERTGVDGRDLSFTFKSDDAADHRPMATPRAVLHVVGADEPAAEAEGWWASLVGSSESGKRRYTVVEAEPSHFDSIVVSSSMLDDHRMTRYRKAIANAVKQK